MDVIGWFVATTHQLLGHDKTAALIGADPGDKRWCILCRYERDPSPANRIAVEELLSP